MKTIRRKRRMTQDELDSRMTELEVAKRQLYYARDLDKVLFWQAQVDRLVGRKEGAK